MSALWADAAAIRIGERMVSAAVVEGDSATWPVPRPVRGSRPRRTALEPADGTLYGGTAGIALFMSELARVTGTEEFARLSRMGLVHSFRRLSGAGATPSPSLHAGAVGPLFAAASYLRHIDDPALRAQADAVLEALASGPLEDRGVDVIGGAAGAIPALFAVEDVFNPDRIHAICTTLGEGLVDAAQVEPEGLSWRSGSVRRANLCGLAHGASGMGRALLELYARTGRTRFRLAAEEAFAYERRWFSAEHGNWADLRNGVLHEYKVDGRLDTLRGLLERDEPLPLYREHHMTAWCHGAAGIAMTRARAYVLLGDGRYREEALAGLPATEHTLHLPGFGDSLCHGFMGNAEALLVVAATLGLEGLRARVLERTRVVTEQMHASGRRWQGGRRTSDPDLSLMTGEAGVGLFLLGIGRPVVSATFPQLPVPRTPWAADDARPLRLRIARECFPRLAEALGPQRLQEALAGEGNPSVPTAAGLEVRLRPAAASDTGAMRALELDLATTRQERSAPFDYSLAVLASAIRVIDLEGEVLATAPWAKIIELGDEDWLLHPDLRGRWQLWAVGQALAALIRQLQTPSTAEATAGQMADETGLDPAKLRPWVHAQLRELVQAGIVIPGPLAEALEETSGPWSSGFPGNRAIPLPEAANILPP